MSRFGILVVWAILIAVFGALKPDTFLTLTNFQTLLSAQSLLLLLSLALIVSMTSGDFDFSLAGLLSINVVLIGQLHIVHEVPFLTTWLIVILVSAVVGALQALLIVGLNLSSFIVTLGSGTAFLGVAAAIDNNTRFGVDENYAAFMSDKFLGIQSVFWIGIVVTLLLWYLYGYTPLGRQLFFVGANKDVARLAGIHVTRLRIASLIGGSVLAGVASIATAGYLNSTDPAVGQNFLLPMVSAALLGTTCIWPGRPNPIGTLVAVYFLVTGYTGLLQLGLSGWVQQVFYGGALVVAAAVATLAARRTGGGAPSFNPQ
ncbi:ABC transporter permease [Rhodococcus sp. NPDC057529]|uniref:ABC transporter permease n=1 Tax=Rhodococcus sp. NPDC057529 TaxID=3346158 RepID=UPI003672FC87